MDFGEVKRSLGGRASRLVEPGMIVGLGTGSTAECFIESLIRRVQHEKLFIQAVASSERSTQLAKKGGIKVLDSNGASHIDLTIDGADEIDPQKRLIKGAGGALLREKILASASREMVVIADETKLVESLGKTKLPIEIVPYGARFTHQKLIELGMRGVWREASVKGAGIRLFEGKSELFLTDNGNVLFDIFFDKPLVHPEKMHEALKNVPGVVDTGLFLGLAKRIFIGYADGRIEEF